MKQTTLFPKKNNYKGILSKFRNCDNCEIEFDASLCNNWKKCTNWKKKVKKFHQ